jgi:thioesterase domain-containing protein
VITSLPQINDYLHQELPLTGHMQITVTAWDQQTLTLKAPLEPNINHADTAFGGSISTLGILAGYMLLFLMLQDRKISNRILIQKSSTDYLRPIDGEMTAVASLSQFKDLDEFLVTLQKRRRARTTLDAQIFAGPALAATHSGLYVAMLY